MFQWWLKSATTQRTEQKVPSASLQIMLKWGEWSVDWTIFKWLLKSHQNRLIKCHEFQQRNMWEFCILDRIMPHMLKNRLDVGLNRKQKKNLRVLVRQNLNMSQQHTLQPKPTLHCTSENIASKWMKAITPLCSALQDHLCRSISSLRLLSIRQTLTHWIMHV